MKFLQFSSLIFIFLACNTPQEEKDETVPGEAPAADTISTIAPSYNPETDLLVWKVDYDYTKIKNPALQDNILVADSLIKGLNQKYENVYLEKLSQGHDTLYTVIKDSKFLSQQMGSSGAEIYLADVVLNLTEVPGIRYVKIDLEPGDHMQPGTWSKENFQKYKTVNNLPAAGRYTHVFLSLLPIFFYVQ